MGAGMLAADQVSGDQAAHPVHFQDLHVAGVKGRLGSRTRLNVGGRGRRSMKDLRGSRSGIGFTGRRMGLGTRKRAGELASWSSFRSVLKNISFGNFSFVAAGPESFSSAARLSLPAGD